MLNTLRKAAACALLLAATGCEVTKVTSPDIQTITLSASASSVAVGSEITIRASLVDSQGRALDRPVTWVADGPRVQVSGTGPTATVRGVSVGTASVRAESEGVVSQSVTISVQNVPATVTTVAPASASVGGAGFTLTVTGRDFANGATVVWNGADRPTTFVSATQVTAAIPTADLATAGTVQVGVRNPTPGGGSANAVEFTVNNPTPVITSVSPASVAAGSGAFTLTVTGTSFVNGATVRWNGTNRVTTFVSGTTLTAAILAADVASAGTGAVTVVNPAPVAAPSNTVNVTVAAASADLSITSFTAPTSGTTGGSLQIQLILVNQGSAAVASAFRVGFYFSTDEIITRSDVFAETICPIPAGLAVSSPFTCTGQVQIPSTLAPGTYFLGAIADDLGAVTETNENNNTRASAAITITAPSTIDLTVTALTAPPTGTAGGTLAGVSMTVANQGTGAAGAFRIGFYFSTDAVITTSDVASPTVCNNTGLAGGASNTCTQTVQVPGSLATGSYFLGAIADDLAALNETNETNNSRATTTAIAITGSNVDLVVTTFTAPPTGVVGGTIQVSLTTANTGTTGSGAFEVGIYYSTDATITTSDVFSGISCDYPSGLAPGASNNCNGPIPVPSSLPPGMYFVGAIADDLLEVTESNETNNTRAAAARTNISASMEALLEMAGADLEVWGELANRTARRVSYLHTRIDTVHRVTTGF